MARWTLAFETSFRVEADSSSTESRCLLALVYVHANLHDITATIPRVTVALEGTGSVPAGAISAHVVRYSALVDVVALDPMLVQGESLIALAAVAANSVLAPAVQAHPRKLDALVDVLLLREPRSSRTQLVVRGGVRLGTGLASFAAPSATHRTAAEALGEVSLYGAGALPVAVLHVAGLLSRVYASGVCSVQSQSRWALATVRAVGVDAGATALADTAVQFALVHVDALFAAEFRVPFGALAESVVADLAGTSPSNADGTAALRLQGQLW